MQQQSNVKNGSAERLTSLELGAWRGFLRVHAEFVRELDAELEERHGLSLTGYDVLVTLEGAPGRRLRMSEVADAVLFSRSGITRLVDRLADEGLVERRPCHEDRRGQWAELTSAGVARLEEARATHLAGVRARFLARLSGEEQREIVALWERFVPGASR